MENCINGGKIICTFDLKDESGIYYEDKVLEWKQAAADRQLSCSQCGAPVYLAAGPVKEPYFAHYDLKDCEYGNGHESEELKRGKRLLYHLLKRSFPEAEVLARYRMDNGMYSTLYCRTKDGTSLAVDYRLQNNSLEKFNLRNAHYQEKQIIPLYVLGIRQEKDTKQIDWYQTLLQSSMGYLAFLDADQECITLKKSFGYRIGKERRFSYCTKSYSIRELKLSAQGQMLCDFTEQCEKLQRHIDEEKQRYENRQGLHPAILKKCRRMIEEGNAHLVSKKYYDAIMSERK